jgi:hypothetical protein
VSIHAFTGDCPDFVAGGRKNGTIPFAPIREVDCRQVLEHDAAATGRDFLFLDARAILAGLVGVEKGLVFSGFSRIGGIVPKRFLRDFAVIRGTG